jgi:biopolymer transport protein ExbD
MIAMADVISFRCPVCKAERFVAKALVGRQARCPACDVLVTISAPPPGDAPGQRSAESKGGAAQTSSAAAAMEPTSDERTIGDADIFRHTDGTPDALPREESTVSGARPSSERTMSGERTVAEQRPVSDERTIFEDRALADERTMVEDFDPYYRWLAIPKAEQPPHHYRLLGLQLFERDPEVILNSSERQMAHVKAQAGGRHVVICQRLLSELSVARICLLDEKKKALYDAELRRSESAKAKSVPVKAKEKAKPIPPSPAAAAPKPQAIAPGPAALVPLGYSIGEPAPPPVQTAWKGAPEPAPSAGEPARDEPTEKIVLRRRIIEGEMDMTPMIDVTFLLLIFFICTASFALTMTKPIPAPKEDEPSTNVQSIEDIEDDPDNITVRIDAYNTFRVITADSDDEAPSYQELVVKLRAARQGGQDGKVPTTLMVIANGEALHEKVVQALDAGTEVGLEKLRLMTVENDDE